MMTHLQPLCQDWPLTEREMDVFIPLLSDQIGVRCFYTFTQINWPERCLLCFVLRPNLSLHSRKSLLLASSVCLKARGRLSCSSDTRHFRYLLSQVAHCSRNQALSGSKLLGSTEKKVSSHEFRNMSNPHGVCERRTEEIV